MTAGARKAPDLMSNEDLSPALDLETASLVSPVVSSRRFASRVGWTFATRLSMVAGGGGASIGLARLLGSRGLRQLPVVHSNLVLALQIPNLPCPFVLALLAAAD